MAVPLLAFFIPLHVAVPFSVILSIIIAGIIIIQDHRKIHFKSAKYLIINAVLGLPFGLALLLYGNELWVKAILGVLIIAYALYALLSKWNFSLKTDSKIWLFVCGFTSGVFGGAYGLNGPPLVLYGDLRQWTTKHFRATLQAYFLPIGLISVGLFAYKDLITQEVMMYSLKSLPVVVPCIFIGRYFNHKLDKKTFIKYVYIGLIVIGILLFKDLFVKAIGVVS